MTILADCMGLLLPACHTYRAEQSVQDNLCTCLNKELLLINVTYSALTILYLHDRALHMCANHMLEFYYKFYHMTIQWLHIALVLLNYIHNSSSTKWSLDMEDMDLEVQYSYKLQRNGLLYQDGKETNICVHTSISVPCHKPLHKNGLVSKDQGEDQSSK